MAKSAGGVKILLDIDKVLGGAIAGSDLFEQAA